MRAWASRCQSSSTSRSIASASSVSPRQSSMSSRASCAGASTSRQSREHGGALRPGQRELAPGAGDLGLRLRLAAARRQRLGEAQRAGAGLRRLAAEEGEGLVERQVLRHLPLAGAAERREPRPVGMARRGRPPYSSQVPAPSRSRVQSTMSLATGFPVQAARVAASSQSPVAVASSALARRSACDIGLRRGGGRQSRATARQAGQAGTCWDLACSFLKGRVLLLADYTIACALKSLPPALAVNAIRD